MKARISWAIAGLALAASALAAMPAGASVLKLQVGGQSPIATALITFTQNGRVSLMRGDGSGRHSVGTGSTYAWSHDGRYLLLVRGGALLLLDPAGAVLRTLATRVSDEDFPPTWAIDGNAILYETSSGASPNDHTVLRVDLSGHSTVLWRYASVEGCGGAAPFAPDALLWQEVGLDDIANGMQWSIARHLAVYSASCRGGLNITDTRTGRTQRLGSAGAAWSEPALSPRGMLAVMAAQDTGGTRSIVLTSPVPGARGTTVAPGELPLWSADGRTLYFEQITAAKPVPYVASNGKHYAAPANVSSIWRVDADGAAPSRLYTQNAYGLGPLSPLAGNAALVFSSVDNVTAAEKQYLVTGSYSPPWAAHLRIMRLDLGSDKATTVLIGAGKPQGQP